MPKWCEDLDRRGVARSARRLPCVVRVAGAEHEAVVEQVSAQAVLVRMESDPAPARDAELEIATPDGVALVLRTALAKPRPVPYRLRGLVPTGVVMHVLEPTDAFLRWVEEPAPCEP
jgi:hypothetical protein